MCPGFGNMEAAGLMRSWRTAEAWHCEKPGEAIGEDTASVAGDPRYWMPGLWETIKESSRCGLELAGQAHVLWMAELEM